MNDPIVCTCFKLSLETIKDSIKEHNITTLDVLIDKTNAGKGCGLCIRPFEGKKPRDYYLVDILKNTLLEIAEDSKTEFDNLTLVQKYKKLEILVTEEINPNLELDGGSLKIIDIEEIEDEILISIQYLGACNGCMSSDQTLMGIEYMLKNTLSKRIRISAV